MLSKAQRESYLQLAHLWRKLADDATSHRQRVEAWNGEAGRSRTIAAGLSGDAADVPAKDH